MSDDPMRAYTRALFTDPDAPAEPEPEAEPDPLRGNVAPKEGNNPELRNDPSADMRAFTAHLFGRDPHA